MSPSSCLEQAGRRTTQPTASPTLLFFHSPRSGRCRRVEGFIAQVLQRRRNHESFAIRRIDCVERPDLAARFRIECVPTLMVVEEKIVRSRLEDPTGCVEIQKFLGPWLH